MPTIDINTDAAVVFTNKLERLHRSGLPIAIRSTLNSVAFDIKKFTMPLEAADAFTQRNKSFFRGTSKVMMAQGFDIKSMRSMVGFVGAEKNQAVDDLEQQERGGTIDGRSFIPMDTARVSQSHKKVVRKQNRFNDIRNLVDARKGRIRGKNPGQRFYKAVAKAGVGGVVLAPYKNKIILWRVNSLKRTAGGSAKLLPLFSYESRRSVQVKATHFMQRATLKSAAKMDRFYKREALKQIKRLTK